MGHDVCEAVKEYFIIRRMLKQAKSTSISLIPKVASPKYLSEFRPISCCNILYKIISKILAGRLRTVLNSIVHLNHSTFIPGRTITDNILLAHELVRGYHRDKGVFVL